MPRFAYTSRDSAGGSSSATLEAPSRKDALRLLAARGVRVTSLVESSAAAPGAKAAAGARPKALSFRLRGTRGGGERVHRGAAQRL